MTDENEPTSASPMIIRDDVPVIYSNGIMLRLSATEFQLITHFNGRPISTIVLPYAAAKSLHTSLGKALLDLERNTGEPVLDLQMVSEKYANPKI